MVSRSFRGWDIGQGGNRRYRVTQIIAALERKKGMGGGSEGGRQGPPEWVRHPAVQAERSHLPALRPHYPSRFHMLVANYGGIRPNAGPQLPGKSEERNKDHPCP